jgi:cysteinyl-tRNA synthetase
MKEAEQSEKLFNEFFLNAKEILRQQTQENEGFVKWTDAEKTMNTKYFNKQAAVHEALCDSVDTPTAIGHMKDLVHETNVYIGDQRHDDKLPNQTLIRNIAVYLTDMLQMFGVIEEEQSIGFSMGTGKGVANVEDIAFPFVSAFAQFRDQVRSISREKHVTDVLKLCDHVRDETLPQLGVRLEDVEGKPSSVKFVDKETLMREKQRENEVTVL